MLSNSSKCDTYDLVVDHGWLGWCCWWAARAARAVGIFVWGVGQGRDASNGNGNECEKVGKLHFERFFDLFSEVAGFVL